VGDGPAVVRRYFAFVLRVCSSEFAFRVLMSQDSLGAVEDEAKMPSNVENSEEVLKHLVIS
jgi:hypothetical protein